MVNQLKEWYTQTVTNSLTVHREKRKFLRAALKELAIVFTDQPGLLGPKVTINTSLYYCRKFL